MQRQSLFWAKIDVIVRWVLSTIIIVVTVLAACSMLLQVVARYIFEISLSGLDEITGHIAVWLYLMGAANGAFERSHIKAEMVHLIIKNKRFLNAIRATSSLISAIVSGYLTIWSYEYVRWSFIKHEVTPALQLPTVIFQFAILFGAALMVVYFMRESIDYVVTAYRYSTDNE